MTAKSKNNETNPTDDFDLISKPPFKNKKITIRIMTAEEKARKYLENKYSELDYTANYDSAGGSELYINEIDAAKSEGIPLGTFTSRYYRKSKLNRYEALC